MILVLRQRLIKTKITTTTKTKISFLTCLINQLNSKLQLDLTLDSQHRCRISNQLLRAAVQIHFRLCHQIILSSRCRHRTHKRKIRLNLSQTRCLCKETSKTKTKTKIKTSNSIWCSSSNNKTTGHSKLKCPIRWMDLEVAFNNSQCKVKANTANLVRTNNNRWAVLAVSSSNQWVNMVPLTLTWTWASNSNQWAWVVEIINLILEVHPAVNQLGKTHSTPSAEQTTTWVASDNSNSSRQPRTRARLSTCSEECH